MPTRKQGKAGFWKEPVFDPLNTALRAAFQTAG
jgi:hypothetical protein